MRTVCKFCSTEKDDSEFPQSHGKRNGYRCLTCFSVYRKEFYARNKERVLAKNAAWKAENKEKAAACEKAWREANKERDQANHAAYYQRRKAELDAANTSWHRENKAQRAEHKRRYVQANLAKTNSLTKKYRARKYQRMPAWADESKIREFYLNCPAGHEVDHVVPLFGELASGLHVHTNLQYLTVEENRSKGNRFDPDTFELS